MKPLLEVTGLRKEFPGFALKDASFSLPAGYVMGLIGPNGAGKTTIIKLILNLVKKKSGKIRVFGLDNESDEAQIKNRIGFVHEVPPFYDHLTGADFTKIVAPFYSRWNQPVFTRLCDEFELPLGKRINALSRGMKMKLALVIALSHEADLLIMDEPTSGLDPVFRRELLDKFFEFMQNEEKSILFSTHITSDLERIADYITLIRDGGICFSDLTDTIKDTWTLVKGGNDLLSEEARRLLRAVQPNAYGFTALTDRAQEIKELLGTDAAFEKPSLGDLVVYLDRRENE